MSGQRHVVPLDKAVHDRAAFACGVDSLDQYLKRQASQDQKRDVARAYVLTDVTEGARTIYGYYTLSSSAVDLTALPEPLRKGLPGYPLVPVVLLGRLAVDQRFKGQGIGKVLLADALARALEVSVQVAVWAVIVDALDEGAAEFYRHFGFLPLPGTPRTLVLPVTTLRLLEKG